MMQETGRIIGSDGVAQNFVQVGVLPEFKGASKAILEQSNIYDT
jgi:hypothetical protein